jgi:quercetin dioxygenase-like cupin family protein
MSVPTGPVTGRAATEAAVVLDTAAIDRLPQQQLHGLRDVLTRVLWRSGGSLAGVIDVGAGEQLPGHAHPEGHHHVWVLSGTAKILGTAVGPGSYVHVPAGLDHAIEDVSAGGLTMFYLYLRAH